MENLPKILNRFVVAVVQKNNSKSTTEKYECPLIEINRYLSLQIQIHTKKLFKLPYIPDNYSGAPPARGARAWAEPHS